MFGWASGGFGCVSRGTFPQRSRRRFGSGFGVSLSRIHSGGVSGWFGAGFGFISPVSGFIAGGSRAGCCFGFVPGGACSGGFRVRFGCGSGRPGDSRAGALGGSSIHGGDLRGLIRGFAVLILGVPGACAATVRAAFGVGLVVGWWGEGMRAGFGVW